MFNGLNYIRKCFHGSSKDRGITLIALIVTIVILLILAGTAISISINRDDLFSKTADAVGKWNAEVAKEERQTDIYTDYLENINMPDPSEYYNYANKEGLTEASVLIGGDIINYYYDNAKDAIPCVVLFNDVSHGLQVVTVDCVRDDIKFGGYGTRAIEIFEDEIPNGYEEATSLDIPTARARWSYNHAFETLKNYAMEYAGYMTKDAKVVGASYDALQNDDSNENVHVLNFNNYSNIEYKNGDNWYLNDEITKMQELGILKTSKSEAYWIASREVYDKEVSSPSMVRYYRMHYIDEEGNDNTHYFIALSSEDGQNLSRAKSVSPTYGLRPIFTLRKNIKVEKIGHLNNN